MNDMPASFFSKDYFEARDRFTHAARNAGATLHAAKHPFAKGPGGRDIFMDCAVLGEQTAEAALVIISGTHGPEGYCGSGVQTGLFETGFAQNWSKKLRVVLICVGYPL
jgi:hypothetical protein